MSAIPRVAVLLAVYNGERYILELLESLHLQTWSNYICYIHDDGSQDRTMEIVESFCERHSDHFYVLEGPPQGGAKNNFLYLMNNVEEEYLMFCDQDDIWMPDKIEKTLLRMQEKEKNHSDIPVLVYSNLEVIDSFKNIIHSSFYQYMNLDPRKNSLKEVLFKNVCWGCTIMINKALWNEAKAIIPSKAFEIHDWPCACIASAEGRISYIDEPLVQYRQHTANVVGAAKEKTIIEKGIRAIKDMTGFYKRKRYYVERPRRMAEALLSLHLLDQETRKLLEEFTAIQTKNKFHRVAFYIKNDLHRQKENRLWELFWV